MTEEHLKYVQLHIFRKSYEIKQFADSRIKDLLDLVGKVFCLQELLACGAGVFDSGFCAPGSLRAMQRAMEQCVVELRPQFVPLVETLYFPDHLTPSVIGNEFGDIYEQQLELAMKSRLNKKPVPEYFERLMKPVLRPKL